MFQNLKEKIKEFFNCDCCFELKKCRKNLNDSKQKEKELEEELNKIKNEIEAIYRKLMSIATKAA
jgi:septal ring factor EnvC (AmiA/AmiB activator)